MACCCNDIREQTGRAKYPTPFELLDVLPTAQSELALIETTYGTDGSGIVSGANSDHLCAGITAYVRAASEYSAAQQELLTYGYSGLALALAGASALALLGFLTGGLGLAAGLAIAGLGGTFGALTGANLVNALRDRNNQNEIICQLVATIVSPTVTRVEYDSAIGGLTSANNQEGAVVFAIQNYFANDMGHYMLLDFVNQAQDGYVTECGCIAPEAINLHVYGIAGAIITTNQIGSNVVDIVVSGGSDNYKWALSNITNPTGSTSGATFGDVTIQQQGILPFSIETQLPLETFTVNPEFIVVDRSYVAGIVLNGQPVQARVFCDPSINLTITVGSAP